MLFPKGKEEGAMGKVPKPRRGPAAAKDRDWNWSGSGAMDKLVARGWDTVVEAHAWYDDSADDKDPPEKKTAYKLPHHDLVGGELKVVWRGVVNAMQVLNGARGGVDIPASDRRKVYEHLAEHYDEFGEEPPELP